MFISLDLNRKNINRAISDNMLKELSMDSVGFTAGVLLMQGRNEHQ
jgi:hypothetical protein